VDHGLAVGDAVTTFYDPMIAKVVAYGADRQAARLGLIGALDRTRIGGLRNNLRFLAECLGHRVFAEGRMQTGFLDGAHFAATAQADPDPALVAIAAALFETRSVSAIDPELRHWRSRPTRPRPLLLESGAWRGSVVVSAEDDGTMRVDGIDGMVRIEQHRGRVTVDGIDHPLALAWSGDVLDLVCGSRQARFVESRPRRDGQAASGTAVIVAPMPGSIVDVRVALGAEVIAGDVLLVLEAMKMETQIPTPVAGRVELIDVVAGQQVALRQVLARIVATPA
jgi:acetyl/propionyl-CoA carboxylase alpha subunit